jgi:hypothetical protein
MATGMEVMKLIDRYSKASSAALGAMEDAIKESRIEEAARWAAISTAYNTALATVQAAVRNM